MLPFSAGAYWGCEGAFTLYDLNDKHSVVYQENAGSGVFVEDSAAEVYRKILENLDEVALSPAESCSLISNYLERYEDGL